jgi:hypothetical protein
MPPPVLLDMRGADLRFAPEAGLQLQNLYQVRCSPATQWPSGWAAWVADNSAEVGSGVWMVRPGDSTADDPVTMPLNHPAAPLVPEAGAARQGWQLIRRAWCSAYGVSHGHPQPPWRSL